jgi:hypothetical protein
LVGNGNDLTVTSGRNDAHLCQYLTHIYFTIFWNATVQLIRVENDSASQTHSCFAFELYRKNKTILKNGIAGTFS